MFLADPRDSDLTFAEPGGNAPFSFAIPKVPGLDPVAMEKQTRLFEAGVLAAERKTRLVDTVNAREQALAEAAENRIRSVRNLTGVVLENPYRGGYELDARDRLGVPITGASPTELSRLQRAQHDIFHEKVDELAQAMPDKAAGLSFGQSIEDQAKAISQSAAQEPGGGFLADVAGGLYGSRRDPLFLASIIAGPGLSAAKTVIARIGFGALKQGLANAGLQALAQPSVQDWRREIGERSGVVPALENVGMALLFGGIVGGGIEVGRAVLNSASRAALSRVARGEASAADVETAARAVGVKLDDTDAAAIKVGEADAAADMAAIGDPPPGVAPQQHAELVAQAVRHAEDPATHPPPDLALVLPPRPPSQIRVLDETWAAAIGDRDVVDGKPVSFGRFDPAELGTDAAAFQYKGGGDAAGVTDRLKHVTRWDALASGKALIFERADGSRVVADGHQRLGLAKRLGAGDAGVRLDGFLFREADGWTPQDVRALAAKKNMQEGSGDAIDAARVLRARPDLLDGAMPISSPMMKNAVALTRLSNEAFGMTINGVVPANYAAAVGSMAPDPLQHAGVLSDLVRFQPETEREARLLIGEIMAAGFRAEQQINLFGAGEAQRSLMGERVKVLDAAIVGLARDKKLFGTLAEKADAIEAAGNTLARDTNDARARDAAQLQDMLTRLARRTGPVSDALNRAAAAMNDGMKPAKAADGFLDEVRALLDRDGLAGLLADPELKPRAIVEPGSGEALASAEAAYAARFEAFHGSPHGSRGKGDGTRNFVVFDHSAVEIVEKNGVPVPPPTDRPLWPLRSRLAIFGDPAITLRADEKIAVSSPETREKANPMEPDPLDTAPPDQQWGAFVDWAESEGWKAYLDASSGQSHYVRLRKDSGLRDADGDPLGANFDFLVRFSDHANTAQGRNPPAINVAPGRTSFSEAKEMVRRARWKDDEIESVMDSGSGLPEYIDFSPAAAKTDAPATPQRGDGLIDSVAISNRADGRDAQFLPLERALQDVERGNDHADIIAACKS